MSSKSPVKLSADGKDKLDRYLHDQAASGKIPALFLGATSADDELYFGCAGDRHYGLPEKGQVNADTTLQLYSMTKFITTLACMLACEKGLLDLDDPACIEKHGPELWEQPILKGYTDDGKEILEKRTQPIRLRHLLTHTAGLCYAWNSPDIARWREEHKVPDNFTPNAGVDSYTQPLIFEPGTHFHYSIGMDWAGIIVSRAAGMTLEEVFQEWIFKPCDVKSITFFPTDKVKQHLMGIMFRPEKGGELKRAEQLPPPGHRLLKRPMEVDQVGPIFMGGGGLFGTARDYLTILRHVLASASDVKSSTKPLLKPESFKKLFTDVTGGNPDVQRDFATMTARQYQHDEELLDGGKGTYFGHGPGLFLNLIDERGRRKAGSGTWDGAAKTHFWIDPTTGIAGVCCTNLLAENPDPWNQTFVGYEKQLYSVLQ